MILPQFTDWLIELFRSIKNQNIFGTDHQMKLAAFKIPLLILAYSKCEYLRCLGSEFPTKFN